VKFQPIEMSNQPVEMSNQPVVCHLVVFKMIWKVLFCFVFAVKQNQPVVSINHLVIFMKTLTKTLFQSIDLENNWLFS